MVEKKRKCIFIIGMHRSGTSALAGVLSLLGCDLGTHLMGPWKGDNPKGFFENQRIFRRNEKFLVDCNSSWDDPFLYGGDWATCQESEKYKADIVDLFNREFGDNQLYVIKDPRICLLFPLWEDIAQRLDVEIRCIFAVRNPFDVANSLQQRDGFSIERGLLMWMNHMVTAENVTRLVPRVFVTYESLLQNPAQFVQDVSQELDIVFPRSWEDGGSEIESFLDKGLMHHRNNTEPVHKTEKLIYSFYQVLLDAMIRRDEIGTIPAKSDTIRKEYEREILFFYNQDVRRMYRQFQVARKELAVKKQHCTNLEQQAIDLESELQRKDTFLADRDHNIHELNTEIEAMKMTKAWRLAEFVRKNKNRLFS